MIILLFGQPASGKTTIANALVNNVQSDAEYFYDFLNIDGDIWRDVTKNVDYSKEGRLRNLKGAFDMALYLERMGVTPILSVVAPYEEIRQYLVDNSQDTILVYLTYNEDRGRNNNFAKDFEEPSNYNLKLDTSWYTLEDCVEKIKDLLEPKLK